LINVCPGFDESKREAKKIIFHFSLRRKGGAVLTNGK